ncbi:MAG: AsmA-like C-terminal region-containing protein, partial [Pseudomonadota bacterium]
LEGSVGVVSVVGPIDFLNKSYDQRIVVLPNVGGSLPVIGAFVGGPLTAASVFLADKVLRGMGVDVNQFGRRDYSLTGDFDAPQLTQLVIENQDKVTGNQGER